MKKIIVLLVLAVLLFSCSFPEINTYTVSVVGERCNYIEADTECSRTIKVNPYLPSETSFYSNLNLIVVDGLNITTTIFENGILIYSTTDNYFQYQF